MRTDKIDQYKLNGGIHTFTIRTTKIIKEIPTQLKNVITSCQVSSDDRQTTITMNLNKLSRDIFRYSDFLDSLYLVLDWLGIENFRYIRTDFRMDNYTPEHYLLFQKLNRLLISAVAVTYSVKNCYRTEDLFSQEQLSIAIKNNYFELENYDREAKSRLTENHSEPAKARLEERTIAREWRHLYFKEQGAFDWFTASKLLKQEFLENWKNRWDKAIENVDLAEKRYNDALEKIYKEDLEADYHRFRSLTDFLLRYQDCIFSNRQMVDLLSRFDEVKNPQGRAKAHKKNYGIEYISKNDLKQALKERNRAVAQFFEN